MSVADIQSGRRRVFLSLIGAVIALSLVSASLAVLNRPATERDPRFGDAVFGSVDELIEATALIEIQLADEQYQLLQTSAGWSMDTDDGYPIRQDRLSALADGLKTLTWQERRTSDPRKHDRIGLGDPAEGGAGARVSFVDGAGDTLASIITGRREDGLYARRPAEQTAYRIGGALPPFYSRDAWMDFAVLSVAPETIEMVEIQDRFGDRLVLSRRAGTGPEAFTPGPGFEDVQLRTAISAAGPGLALSRFAPRDAKPANRLETEQVARLVTVTFDGLEISASAYNEPDGNYVTLRAIEAGNAAARARSINEQAEGWAFRLADFDFDDFTAPVTTLVTPTPAPQVAVGEPVDLLPDLP